MKYKAGDQVRIKSIDWYNENINNNSVIICGSESFTHPMSCFCGKVVTIVTIQDDCYRILEDDGDWYWTDEMIEGLVEEEIIDLTSIVMETVEEKTIQNTLTYGYNLPEGYQFVDENGNVINATKIVLEKKKKEYPKTYGECCKIMDIDTGFLLTSYDLDFWKGHLLTSLQKLLICRDAYWKIAGEEMGLGKPWEPSGNEDCFVISRSCGEVYLYSSGGDCEPFEFPTKEMRDAFYENFKELINKCKELL